MNNKIAATIFYFFAVLFSIIVLTHFAMMLLSEKDSVLNAIGYFIFIGLTIGFSFIIYKILRK